MGRSIAAVVVGFIAMMLVVFIGLTIAWFVMGADRAFEPGVYDVSYAWITASLIVNLIAAVIGGMVCVKIANRGPGPWMGLALIVLILGFVNAMMVFQAQDGAAAERPADITMLEAMSSAQQPLGIVVATPIIGAVGIAIGARLLRGTPILEDEMI